MKVDVNSSVNVSDENVTNELTLHGSDCERSDFEATHQFRSARLFSDRIQQQNQKRMNAVTTTRNQNQNISHCKLQQNNHSTTTTTTTEDDNVTRLQRTTNHAI